MTGGNIKYIAEKVTSGKGKSRFVWFVRIAALLSVMLGSMALILSLSVLEGFDDKLHENAIKFSSHISIKTFNRTPIYNYHEVMNTLRDNYSDLEAMAPVIEREGLVRTKTYTDGVVIRGMQPGLDITSLEENLKEGHFAFSSDSAREAIIGVPLANKLNVKPGDKIILYTLKNAGLSAGAIPDARISRFKVRGLYRTGMSQYDETYIFIPMKSAAGLYRIPPAQATSIDIMLKNPEEAISVSRHMDDQLGFPYFTETVYEKHSAIFSWIELQKQPIPIVLALISIVAVLNIITTLLVIVVEKTRTIGILRSLGMKGSQIVSIFVFRGTMTGFIGTISGSLLAFILCLIQQKYEIISLKGEIYFLDAIPISMSPWHFVIVIGVSVFMAFLATFIPALIAVRISPARALRFK